MNEPKPWLWSNGPWLVLLLGVAGVVVGVSLDDASVVITGLLIATFGAVLPRLRGRFKVGPGGIEGGVDGDEVVEAVQEESEQAHLAPEAQAEAVAEARELVPPGGRILVMHPDDQQLPPRHRLTRAIARGIVYAKTMEELEGRPMSEMNRETMGDLSGSGGDS